MSLTGNYVSFITSLNNLVKLFEKTKFNVFSLYTYISAHLKRHLVVDSMKIRVAMKEIKVLREKMMGAFAMYKLISG